MVGSTRRVDRIYLIDQEAVSHPLFAHDRRIVRNYSALVGVDEAGRGPLAGPVVAAAVGLLPEFYQKKSRLKILKQFDDSKKIPEEIRLELYDWLESAAENELLRFHWAEASVEEIEEINILQATSLAMNRAISELPEYFRPQGSLGDLPLFQETETPPPIILVDGKPVKALNYPHQAIVKGDGTSLAIAMASIVAKTIRDKMMVELDKEYPQYGFAQHKGYGTQQHRNALHQHGPSKVHRATFLRKILNEKADS